MRLKTPTVRYFKFLSRRIAAIAAARRLFNFRLLPGLIRSSTCVELLLKWTALFLKNAVPVKIKAALLKTNGFVTLGPLILQNFVLAVAKPKQSRQSAAKQQGGNSKGPAKPVKLCLAVVFIFLFHLI